MQSKGLKGFWVISAVISVPKATVHPKIEMNYLLTPHADGKSGKVLA